MPRVSIDPSARALLVRFFRQKIGALTQRCTIDERAVELLEVLAEVCLTFIPEAKIQSSFRLDRVGSSIYAPLPAASSYCVSLGLTVVNGGTIAIWAVTETATSKTTLSRITATLQAGASPASEFLVGADIAAAKLDRAQTKQAFISSLLSGSDGTLKVVRN